RPSEQQHVLHNFGHLASGLDNVIELFAALLGLQALEIAVEVFCGGENHTQWSAELVRDHRDKTAAQFAQFALVRQRMVQVGLRLLALGNLSLEFGSAP